MTYAQFLLLFLILPLVAIALVLRRRLFDRRLLLPAATLMVVALLYMAPWDHLAAVWGVWTWTPGRTWGIRLWDVPPEEYLFCVLETLLAVALTYALYARRSRKPSTSAPKLQEGEE
jgi:lycopene cyclase domain-containing protein